MVIQDGIEKKIVHKVDVRWEQYLSATQGKRNTISKFIWQQHTYRQDSNSIPSYSKPLANREALKNNPNSGQDFKFWQDYNSKFKPSSSEKL